MNYTHDRLATRSTGQPIAHTDDDGAIVDDIGTDLDETLRGMGVDTLIFSGVFAEICVESTARHAAELEYKVIYVSDLVASYTTEQHKACLERIRFAFGMVMSSEDLLAEISKLPIMRKKTR